MHWSGIQARKRIRDSLLFLCSIEPFVSTRIKWLRQPDRSFVTLSRCPSPLRPHFLLPLSSSSSLSYITPTPPSCFARLPVSLSTPSHRHSQSRCFRRLSGVQPIFQTLRAVYQSISLSPIFRTLSVMAPRNPPSRCLLRLLPPEVRQAIYTFGGLLDWDNISNPVLIRALRPERGLYFEALSMFYVINTTFILGPLNDYGIGLKMCDSALSSIRCLVIDVTNLSQCSTHDHYAKSHGPRSPLCKFIHPSYKVDYARFSHLEHVRIEMRGRPWPRCGIPNFGHYQHFLKMAESRIWECLKKLPRLVRLTISAQNLRPSSDQLLRTDVARISMILGVSGKLESKTYIGTMPSQPPKVWWWEAEDGSRLRDQYLLKIYRATTKDRQQWYAEKRQKRAEALSAADAYHDIYEV